VAAVAAGSEYAGAAVADLTALLGVL